MWTFPASFDVIVIGAGHAGCEAAHAAARMGCRTLMLTMSLDTIGKMSCNPAIGGTAKGQLVREIDALGGLMGQAADATGIHFRMLNRSKGPAVWAPRAQSDRVRYQQWVKHHLERTPNLSIKQGTIERLLIEEGRVLGVSTREGILYHGKRIILSAGTFMRGLLHIGEQHLPGGRNGCAPSVGLSGQLEQLGFRLIRLKTGTPARIHRRSVRWELCEEQPGEEEVAFSFGPTQPRLPQVSCHITYTTEKTGEVVAANLHRSPMYSGRIEGVGPRYCPSIEDKFVRFPDKLRHQLFLEPEGLDTEEIYISGMSSSLPIDVQMEMLHSIPALAQAEMLRPAYAVEYDALGPGQFDVTFESRHVAGLFFAGQICGTSGYEEAAGQGILAGINAALQVRGEAPFILGRDQAYLGVMADDLASKEILEPYRMFTSRAEYRLLLRQDNADQRLTSFGHALGIVSAERYEGVLRKQATLHALRSYCSTHRVLWEGQSLSIEHALRRPECTMQKLQGMIPELACTSELAAQVEMDIKYAGYIRRQLEEAEQLRALEEQLLPVDLLYEGCAGLSSEAREKLMLIRPRSMGQASRIAGVTPADLLILRLCLKRQLAGVS